MTSEWNHSTINDVCVLVTDGSHSSPKSVNDGEYMVSVKDFTDYGFDFASCRMISHDDYETLKRNGCVPQIDDILIMSSIMIRSLQRCFINGIATPSRNTVKSPMQGLL